MYGDAIDGAHAAAPTEAARRQSGWAMSVRDRSNEYCTDLVGAWAGPRHIVSRKKRHALQTGPSVISDAVLIHPEAGEALNMAVGASDPSTAQTVQQVSDG